MTLPTFTDLGALAEDLAKHGADPSIRAAITTAWRVQSCLGDLRQAEQSMKALRKIADRERDEDSQEVMTIERALMTAAVLHYARATSTSGQKGERGSIQLEQSRLSPDEWSEHSKIIEVRNQAIAHVYSGRSAGDHVWHRDIFFAVETPEGHWAAASATNQTSYHLDTLRRLERMLPVAIREIRAKFDKRMAAVTRMLNEKVKAAMFRKHAFDPTHVFGSEETARAILAGRARGDSVIWTNRFGVTAEKPIDE